MRRRNDSQKGGPTRRKEISRRGQRQYVQQKEKNRKGKRKKFAASRPSTSRGQGLATTLTGFKLI